MVCEVGSVVVTYNLVSHMWWCSDVVNGTFPEAFLVSCHRCAHGGPFPSIIHLSLNPMGAKGYFLNRIEQSSYIAWMSVLSVKYSKAAVFQIVAF